MTDSTGAKIRQELETFFWLMHLSEPLSHLFSGSLKVRLVRKRSSRTLSH